MSNLDANLIIYFTFTAILSAVLSEIGKDLWNWIKQRFRR